MPFEWRGIGGPGSTEASFRSAISDNHTPIGIVGCDVSGQPDGSQWPLGYFQTCGDGWINVDFWVPETLTFNDQSQLLVSSFDGTTWGQCEFGKTCLQVTATPEPGTLVLFGSGLVGVLGIRRRRKAIPSTSAVA